MIKKQVKFDPENLARLGKKGTCEDDKDSAFKKLLDLDDDINRCLEGEEPQTEKLQKLKRKWCVNMETKERGFKEAKWPGLTIATQDTELPKDVIEKIKTNCKTSYEELIKNCGGEVVKLGECGTTFDPCMEISKLPDDIKQKLTEELIKIIEKNEAEKQEKKQEN